MNTRVPDGSGADTLLLNAANHDPMVAPAVLDQVMDCAVALCRQLDTIAATCAATAPISSQQTSGLRAAVAGTVLEWIEGWPNE